MSSIKEIMQKNLDNIDNPENSKKIQQLEITPGNVLIASELIEELGEKPTQNNVRSALGGGSFTTIGPILKDMKLTKSEEHELEEVDIPVPVEDRAKQLLGEVWKSAISEAEQKLQLQREELRIAQEEAQQEVDDSRDAIKTLEKEAELKVKNIEEKENLISELNTTLKNKDDEFNKLDSELKACEINLTNKVENILKIEADLKKSREDFDAERFDNKKLNDEKTTNLTELARLKHFENSYHEEKNQNKLLIIENNAHVIEIDRLKSLESDFEEKIELNKTLTKANGSLEKDNKILDFQQQKIQSTLDLLVNTHNDLKIEEKKLRKSFDDKTESNGSLSGRLELVTGQNKELSTRVRELEEKLSSVKK